MVSIHLVAFFLICGVFHCLGFVCSESCVQVQDYVCKEFPTGKWFCTQKFILNEPNTFFLNEPNNFYSEFFLLLCIILLGYPPGLSSLVFFVRNVGEINSTVFNSTNLSSATSLTMTQCGITAIAPGAFAQFQNLKMLNLRNNDLSQITSDWFTHKEVLESLILTNNSITVLNENSFAGLVGLLILNVSQNRIHAITSNSFRFLTRLRHLDLSYNKLRHLSVNTLMPLNKTKILLYENPWDCSCGVYEFSLYLRGTCYWTIYNLWVWWLKKHCLGRTLNICSAICINQPSSYYLLNQCGCFYCINRCLMFH